MKCGLAYKRTDVIRPATCWSNPDVMNDQWRADRKKMFKSKTETKRDIKI